MVSPAVRLRVSPVEAAAILTSETVGWAASAGMVAVEGDDTGEVAPAVSLPTAVAVSVT